MKIIDVNKLWKSEKESLYTGEQLKPNYFRSLSKDFETGKDFIVYWSGATNVKLEEMKDIDDVREDLTITSDLMQHFIFQFPSCTDPVKLILVQRMFTRIVKQTVQRFAYANGSIEDELIFRIKGNDILYTDYSQTKVTEKKLSVSIAVPYHSVGMIHFGYNISNSGGPTDVEIGSLTDLHLTVESETVALSILNTFSIEFEDVLGDAYKAIV